MSHFSHTLLAARPEVHLPPAAASATLAHLSYRIGPGLQLLRARSALPPEGGFLMLSGEASCYEGNVARFCRQVCAECQARHMTGVVSNLGSSPQCIPLVTALDRALTEAGLIFWVSEPVAAHTADAQVMVSSQLSGGSLAVRLQDALQQWGRRVVLAVECTPWDFCLPCAAGRERPLDDAQVKQLLTTHGVRTWFSQTLCTQYFTYQTDHQLHLVQFQTGYSVRKKMELAKQLHLSGILLSWDEVHPFVNALFSPGQKKSR